ncbi:allantoate permease [Teratosphaeria nubilosa]|uniref:Allantoate permease n=1 Tax=Teratosphaeria nubilosa TaxID=161662 RepID=A0A6G1L1Z6_9PEZI|nr:allantoate permease [Teratosphaeria nubilosa]
MAESKCSPERVEVAMGAIDAAQGTKPALDAVEIERVVSPDELKKDDQDYGRIDAGCKSTMNPRLEYTNREVAKYTAGAAVEISPEENARLYKMINKRVLPIMVFTYFLQALDKGTLSFTSIMGIKKDLYSWLTTAIYIAILFVEFPINRMIARIPIGKFLGTAIILWGTILAVHAACTNFTSILACRILLGISEAVCQPSFLIMSSMWYKREEQALIVTFWYMMNGGQQIVGGLLAYCFTLIETGPLKSWQAIFITYGCFSVLYGIFVLSFLPDSPMRAKCFSESDKILMVERVRSNQTGIQNRRFRVEQLWEALGDVQTWCYCLIQFTTTLPTSGLGAFANIIITGFGFTVLQTQLLAMVLGAFIIGILLSSTWLVKKTGQNLLIMGIYVIPSFIGTVVLMTVANTDTATEAGLLFSYYIVLSFWCAQTLGMSMLSRNVAGQTKKSVCVALNFVSWATGNAIGPQVFLAWNAPRYFIAFATHMGCYAVLVIAIVVLRFHLKRENEKRDAAAAAGVSEARDERLVRAFEDLTDRENKGFRYVY